MRWLRRLLGLSLAGALAAAAALGYFASAPIGLVTDPTDFTIAPGATLRMAARQIEAAGVRMPAWAFTVLARTLGKASAIKAGSYEVRAGITPLQLLNKLTRGDVSQAEIVFPEGWTLAQIRAALDANEHLRHDSTGLDDRLLLERLGQTGAAEGRFFPDTYLFAKGSSDLDILARSLRQMDRLLQTEWRSRRPGLPYASPYEALIMASIVEKETGQARDRPQIATVFVNRLRRGMLLQTDPTVIYGLGARFDGNLRKRDLQADGPYNTYVRGGLPPTPIASPGLASIRAALHPLESDMLYFVARGDGTSQFSRTLDEHNRAVNQYQKKRNR